MDKRTFVSKFWLAAFLVLVLIIPTTDAFAREWKRSLPARHETVRVDHQRYYYRDGRFYRPGFFGFGFFMVRPRIGVVIRVLPASYRTIVVSGVPYYYYDDIYYRPCSTGYEVVPAPVVSPNVVMPPQNLSSETVTINVPNSNGSFTPVTLVKRGNGYIGPQGEYYPGHPTLEQLRMLYGK
jgi:hypothetical protein